MWNPIRLTQYFILEWIELRLDMREMDYLRERSFKGWFFLVLNNSALYKFSSSGLGLWCESFKSPFFGTVFIDFKEKVEYFTFEDKYVRDLFNKIHFQNRPLGA